MVILLCTALRNGAKSPLPSTATWLPSGTSGSGRPPAGARSTGWANPGRRWATMQQRQTLPLALSLNPRRGLLPGGNSVALSPRNGGATISAHGDVAQLAERRLCKADVTGSIPATSIREYVWRYATAQEISQAEEAEAAIPSSPGSCRDAPCHVGSASGAMCALWRTPGARRDDLRPHQAACVGRADLAAKPATRARALQQSEGRADDARVAATPARGTCHAASPAQLATCVGVALLVVVAVYFYQDSITATAGASVGRWPEGSQDMPDERTRFGPTSVRARTVRAR